MKKSECYKMAQIAVVESTVFASKEKLEVLGVLMAEESLQAFIEAKEEEGAE